MYKKYISIAIIFAFISFNFCFASDKPTNGSVGNSGIDSNQNNNTQNSFNEEDLKEDIFNNTSVDGTLFYDKDGNLILNLNDLNKYDIVYDEHGNPIYVKELTEEDLKLYTFEGNSNKTFLDENGNKVDIDKISNSSSSENNKNVDSKLTLYIMMLGIGSGVYFFNAKNL